MGVMTNDPKDQELLKRYVHEGLEESFRKLVERHVDLVYGAAFRQLNNRSLAEEVTQNVFVTLTRRARWLTGHPSLAGWLYHTAVNHARQQSRTEQRRQLRETVAAQLGGSMQSDESLLKSLTPILDEAMLELREADREALVLRYVEDRSLREVGTMLGISEDTAQKRVARALEALTGRFRRRGYKVAAVTTTAAALRMASNAAPAGLSTAAAEVALSAGSAVTTSGLGLLIAKIMGLTKTQMVVFCALVAAGPVTYEWHAAAKAGKEQRVLREEISQVGKQLNERQTHLDETQKKLTSAGNNLKRIGGETDKQKELAAASRAAAATNLYLWDEASDYVRLPKSIINDLTLSSSYQLPGVRRGYRLEQFPVLGEDGSLAEQLTESLGITPAEEAHIRQAYQEFTNSYQHEIDAHTLFTNVPPEVFGVGKRESTSRVRTAFATEGETLKEQLQKSIATTLGTERGDVVWRQVENDLNNRFNNFGKEDFIETVAWEGQGSFRYWKGHRSPQYGNRWLPSMVTEMEEKNIPEAFRPYRAQLKPANAK
jgi:RNA polymerase sigma factor (sigma-70 family)